MNNVRMDEMRDDRVNFRISRDLKERATAVARVEKRPLSNLIEKLLEDAIEQTKVTDPKKFNTELGQIRLEKKNKISIPVLKGKTK